MIRSEFLKLKSSLEIMSTVFFGFVVMICEILIFMSKSSIDVNDRMGIQISIMFILLILNTAVITNRSFNREKSANNLQNILGVKKIFLVWFAKLSVLSLLEIFIFGLAEVPFEMFWNLNAFDIVLLTIIIQTIISVGIHMWVQFAFGDIVNIILGIVEIILILFATNIPMKNWYYFPCCYGYKIYEYFNSMSLWQWGFVFSVIVAVMLLNFAIIYKKIKKD